MPNNAIKENICLLKETAGNITSIDNIDHIAKLVLDLAINLTGAQKGSVMLLDEKGDLVVRAAIGPDAGLISNLSVKIGDGICGRVAAERLPLLV
ncbi:MAG: GAF domain-containing protein, partial [Nitrospirota bacterium]|nr:GAF domain-containing protein [Nitrospirota bacterium]